MGSNLIPRREILGSGHTGSQVPSMTCLPTWQHFLEVRLGNFVESWVEQRARANTQHNISRSYEYFCIK